MLRIEQSGRNSYFYVLSSRGKPQLVCNGYSYHIDHQLGDKTFWRCLQYYRGGCRARCIVHGCKIIPGSVQHNHGIFADTPVS
ncbi:hypothetical protein PR048_032479 [Dryococelus australis]|uniref:FLYWCH-type domain-containing protein n=1 Tax=Dryococelus australis TaxID=614101 RepID=A0ABQ9G2A9_9NEOP|nr:hypothetical protein PR048_032479 [Dryococelus australis]